MTGLPYRLAAAGMVALASLAVLPAAAGTLDEVKARGFVTCGVSDRLPGFSFLDEKSERVGFEIDHCRALAAAIFGDASKFRATPLIPRDAFTTLASGGIDIFSDRATWTFLRDAGAGFDYAGIYLFDGQGFMVLKKANLASAKQLDGATICTTQGTTNELTLTDFFSANRLRYRPVTFADPEESRRAYEEGRCDAWTVDRTVLASRGLGLKNRQEHIILPETISREPIGPMVRENDSRWRDVAFWVLQLRVAGEQHGITQANVDEIRSSAKDPEIQRMLGTIGEFGKSLGLPIDWGYQVIKQTGNYAETWERHLGPRTPLGLERGPSALWRDGGLMYPLPFR